MILYLAQRRILMVKKCAKCISSFCVSKNLIDSSKYEWCCYVVEKKLVKIISFIFLLVVGYKMNILHDLVIFTASFCYIRKYADGFHAKTFLQCLTYSISIILLAIKYVSPFIEKHIVIRYILLVLLFYIFYVEATFFDRKFNNLFIRNTITVSFVVIFCEFMHNIHCSCLVISSMIFTMITILLKQYNERRNYGH